MIFDRNAIKVFGISCHSWSLEEDGNQDVGNMFNNALTFVWTDIEPSQSMTKSLKKLNIELYEGVGQILVIDDDGDYPTLLFDCGIYAFSLDQRLPKGIESGMFVKMRFYLIFDDGHLSMTSMNDEPLSKAVPGMIYDWKIKDILIWAKEGKNGEKYFENLPIAYTSPEGYIYKRVSGTDAYNQTGRYPTNTNYILICEML